MAAPSRRSYIRLASLIGGITLIVVLGYLVFVFFLVSFRPTVGFSNLLLFAVIAGVAAFFSPCNFPMIPGYLSYFHAATGKEGNTRSASHYGVIAALGIVTFNLLIGGAMGILGEAFGKSLALSGPDPNPFVRGFRGIVGFLLITLGLMGASGRSLGLGFVERFGHRLAPSESSAPAKGIYLYGFGYNAISVGCTGPILVGLSIFAISWGGFNAAFLAFLIFSLTMASLMILLSAFSEFAGGRIVGRLSRSTPQIVKAAGLIQAVVGGFLVFSSVYTDIFVRTLFPRA